MQDADNQPLTGTSEPLAVEPTSAPRRRPPGHRLLFNERGLRAGWRLLVWSFLCLAFAYLLQGISLPLSRHIPHRLLARFGQVFFVIAILGGNFVMSRLEHRSVFSYGFSDPKWVRRLLSGALFGWLSLTLMLAGMDLAHHFQFGTQYMHGSALIRAAISNAASFLFAVALFEELLFRGYALYTLADGLGFWPASVLLSLVFAAAHISNNGEAKVGIAAIVFFGAMLCFSIWRTGSLLWALGFHFMWDYSESFLYGVPDSGFVSPQHLLSARFSGPAWITGGTVGPEGSFFIFLVLALTAVLLHLLYPAREFRRSALSTERSERANTD